MLLRPELVFAVAEIVSGGPSTAFEDMTATLPTGLLDRVETKSADRALELSRWRGGRYA
jgi:hypothetical protein